MRLRALVVIFALAAAFAPPGTALAAFHLMEIEQVIGGVNGDTSAQAVQLRYRSSFQNVLNPNARLVVRDATGSNPVVLLVFPAPNPLQTANCTRILITTPNFQFTTTPPALPGIASDYVMARIPDSYLAAGSLTFENAGGTLIYWRTSWGGLGYSGLGTVVPTGSGGNDPDGQMNPPFANALPSTGLDALRLTTACTTPPAVSTDNATMYQQTPGPAAFTDKEGITYNVSAPASAPVPVLPSSSGLWFVVALGAVTGAAAVLRRRSA